LIETFGTPTNEAERYFFNACSEAIKRDKVVLYASRIPYLNNATSNYKYTEYSFKKAAVVLSAIPQMDVDLRNPGDMSAYSDLLALKTVIDADATLSDQFVYELGGSELKSCA